MSLKEYVEFASANPVCFFATSENNQPHVRGMLLFFADESGFYFGTLSPKEMFKQLQKNPQVEVCFYNNPEEMANAKTMRVKGKIEFVNDPQLKHRLHEERKFLDDIVGENLEAYNEIFKLASGDIHFWTMKDVMKEKQLEHLQF